MPRPTPAVPPLVSVITPAYNVAPYLPDCIESVLKQSHGSLELLAVDDGSTDGTSDVIAGYAAKDARVRGFRGPNRGVSHARNVALRHARGKFFALIDGDDLWEPTFLAEQLRVFRREPDVAIVSGNAWNMGGPLDATPVRPWPAEPVRLTFLDMIEHVDAVFIMSVLRREVYETLGGFNEALFRSEDYEFWLRAAAAGFTIATSPQPLGSYRRRGDSATTDHRAMFDSIERVLAASREFRHRPRADELGAIDRQIERLRSDRLLTLGKAALLRRDFTEARSHFRELHQRGGGFHFGALAAALGIAPGLVRSAYKRRLERLARRAGMRNGAVSMCAEAIPRGGTS